MNVYVLVNSNKKNRRIPLKCFGVNGNLSIGNIQNLSCYFGQPRKIFYFGSVRGIRSKIWNVNKILFHLYKQGPSYHQLKRKSQDRKLWKLSA